ncbi:MAG: histidinol dehydrogenase [Candidatus Competibacterales bacterium]|nr:histidinol dehydrogenase [Candidatus Competibacterales bacterium]
MSRTVRLHELARLDPQARAALLERTESDLGPFLEAVRPVIEAVRREGDAALLRFAREFDRAEIPPGTLKAAPEDFDRAFARLAPEVREAIDYAVDNIRRFHEAQKPQSMWLEEIRPGVFVGEKWTPISSVALYVPRGKGSFPSMVMMSAVPAVVAGVPRVVIVTPPGPDGGFDDATLVAARCAGVEAVYKCGGAQAVAAVAYGTETVPRVAKIVGPGSPYVVAAKRLLAERIDPGTPAGPSESIILADDSSDPRLVALDLIIESEHGDDSSTYLVTPSRELAAAVQAAVPEHWARMGEQRVGYSSAVLGGPRGGIVLTADLDEAVAFVNDYAPEHLQILTAEPHALLGRIHHAGEILLGEHSPSVLANYLLGPNAILPTGGAARTASPLSVFDFIKRSSIGHVTAAGYPEPARHTRVLAEYEGFDGHALAVSPLRDRLLRRS